MNFKKITEKLIKLFKKQKEEFLEGLIEGRKKAVKIGEQKVIYRK